jgi:hypothetical protein
LTSVDSDRFATRRDQSKKPPAKQAAFRALEPLRYEPQAALSVGPEPQAALFRFVPFMNDLPIDYGAVLQRPA